MNNFKIIMLVLIVTALYTCQKDDFSPPNATTATVLTEETDAIEWRNPDVRTYHLTIRTEEVVQLAGPGYPVTECGTPKTGYVIGQITHLGKLKSQESTYEIQSCNFNWPILENTVKGQWTAANGDKLFYNGQMELTLAIDPATGQPVPVAFESSGQIYDGSGRFEEAEGTFSERSLPDGSSIGQAVIYVPKNK